MDRLDGIRAVESGSPHVARRLMVEEPRIHGEEHGALNEEVHDFPTDVHLLKSERKRVGYT